MTHGSVPVASRSTLVVTAHAGDFVWRAGGAIALAASRGEKTTIACLTFGERGESAKAWREGRNLEERSSPTSCSPTPSRTRTTATGAIQQTFFLYVYEPGGNRVELLQPAHPAGAGPRLAADHLDQERAGQGAGLGLKTIESFHTHGTPPVD